MGPLPEPVLALRQHARHARLPQVRLLPDAQRHRRPHDAGGVGTGRCERGRAQEALLDLPPSPPHTPPRSLFADRRKSSPRFRRSVNIKPGLATNKLEPLVSIASFPTRHALSGFLKSFPVFIECRVCLSPPEWLEKLVASRCFCIKYELSFFFCVSGLA